MKSVVVFASHSGNTRLIAAEIARGLETHGPTLLVAAEDASATVASGFDLFVAGAPTEGRHASPPMHAFFDRLPSHALSGISAAAFDTRLALPRFVIGSAAADIGHWLDELDALVVVPPESFIVSAEPRLRPGELERAFRWATSLADVLEPLALAV